MREVLSDLEKWQQAHEQIALATLVRVRGSAPRLPGARMCVTRSGRMAGSVSGGCVENDVFEHAMQVLDSGQPRLTTYGITDEIGLQVGLSCGGSIDVLIEPFIAAEAWEATRQAVADQRPAALCIGLAPVTLLGRKLAVRPDGTTAGSIDRAVDGEVGAAARELLATGGTRILAVPWQGQEARIYIEAFPPPPRLFIVGATHIAAVLCRMAKGLGFRVIVIDPRGLYATRERFPDADELLTEWPHAVLDGANLDAFSYVVVLTHDPKFDVPTLATALRSQARYIGVMGNRRTFAHRKARLIEQGFGEAEVSRIRAPIGLDLGGRTPDEMALAILAEMTAVRYGKTGHPLAEEKGAIHADK